jgi:hypothetical protein
MESEAAALGATDAILIALVVASLIICIRRCFRTQDADTVAKNGEKLS